MKNSLIIWEQYGNGRAWVLDRRLTGGSTRNCRMKGPLGAPSFDDTTKTWLHPWWMPHRTEFQRYSSAFLLSSRGCRQEARLKTIDTSCVFRRSTQEKTSEVPNLEALPSVLQQFSPPFQRFYPLLGAPASRVISCASSSSAILSPAEMVVTSVASSSQG